MAKIKKALKANFPIVIAMILCALMILFSSSYYSTTYQKKQTAKTKLVALQNEISTLQISQEEVNYVVVENETGLDLRRVNSDTSKFTNDWIKPAFTWQGANEYNEHRKIFVERLGEKDQFVVDIMPEFIPGITAGATYDDDGNIISSEGDKLNMRVKEVTAHVIGIKKNEENRSKDIYSYLTVVKTETANKNGYTGDSQLVLTYDIDGEGNVSNFHAAVPAS